MKSHLLRLPLSRIGLLLVAAMIAAVGVERMTAQSPTDDPQRNIQRMFRLALGRPPTPREVEIAHGYLQRNGLTDPSAPRNAEAYRHSLARACKVVLNLNEMVYID